jgi:hypothetical protein
MVGLCNLIDIQIEKLFYMILLVSYLKNIKVKFAKSIIVFLMQHQKRVAIGPQYNGCNRHNVNKSK